MVTPTNVAHFGDIHSLKHVFADAKKLRPARCPAHVMIVEDDPLTRRVVAGALGENHAMISEENARGAVASYLLHAPDIVFLDIGLPDVDGFAVLDQIMAIDTDAFIVMLSSHSDAEHINKALAARAKGFVPKPFNRETLKSYILDSSVHHHKSCQ